MRIWQCEYEEFVNGQVITSIKQFDDRDILYDYSEDPYDAMILYMMSKCVIWCHDHKAKLVSFEIIAE